MSFVSVLTALSPLAWWRLGEASGTVAADATGNGRDAIYEGAVTLGRTGLVDDADTSVYIPGHPNYVRVADAAWMDTAHTTYGILFILDNVDGGLITRWNSSGRTHFAIDYQSGTLRCYANISGTTRLISAAVGDLVDTQKHMAVGTYDGTTLRLYLDGAEIASGAWTGSLSATVADIYIGTRQDNPTATGNNLALTADEPFVCDYAITAADVTDLWNAATGATPSPVSGTLAATLPALSANLSGTSTPPAVSGSLASTLPALRFTAEGGTSSAELIGTLGSTLPVLTVNLSGNVAPIGTLSATLPALTTSLSGLVAAPGEISGVLAAQLPTVEVLFRGGSATPTTDTFNRSNGRTRSGSGWANQDEPVATVPATLTREPIRVMAQTLPAPTLEKGRPV